MAVTIHGTDGLTFNDSSTQSKSAATGQTGAAPFYTARAWVNFNGTGTVAIRASGNVSSITDNGTGQYQANFTNAMPDGNYSVAGLARYTNNGSTDGRCVIGNNSSGMATTSVQISFLNAADTAVIDPVVYCVLVFR